MSRILSIVLLSLLLASCKSKPIFEPSMKFQNIRPELHIGEYSVVKDSHSLFTVSRGMGPNTGVVEVDVDKSEIKVLDPKASEARDLFWTQKELYYRVDEQIFKFASGKVESLQTGIKKLHAVYPAKNFQPTRLIGTLSNESDALLCLSNPSRNFPIFGKLLASHPLANSQILLFIEGQRDLVFALADCESGITALSVVEKEAQSSAAKFYQSSDSQSSGKLWLAYLQEEKGTLNLASINPESFKVEEIETVGGKEYESYVGMDIAFFEDGEKPGLLFLEAENLKLHLSRFKQGQWAETRVPISGALGFYNCVLERKKNSLRMTTHAFRSINANGKYEFENLLAFDLDLP